MVALPVVAGSVLLVLSAARKNKSQRQAQTPVVVTHESGQITTTDVINPSPQPSVEEAPATATTVNVESADILLMTEKLATQISGKSGYEFAPELIELIRTRAQEYNNAKALLGARQFRREINKSFRDEGLTPLVGYALAMSRSKFDPTLAEKGLGIWQISLPVARSQGYVGAADNGAKLRAPESSAQISASYTRQLLSAFDADDFMYAIACFGMNLEEAGSLQARLVNAAPNSKDRREVEVDTETGRVRLTRLVNVADVGAPINPKIVETQLSGASIMQLGFSLFEKMQFDADGQLRNASFAEYKIPGFHDRRVAQLAVGVEL